MWKENHEKNADIAWRSNFKIQYVFMMGRYKIARHSDENRIGLVELLTWVRRNGAVRLQISTQQYICKIVNRTFWKDHEEDQDYNGIMISSIFHGIMASTIGSLFYANTQIHGIGLWMILLFLHYLNKKRKRLITPLPPAARFLDRAELACFLSLSKISASMS